ncbi:MAG TPA: hypothetical protein VMV81_01715 [Phycisphaerae bacterium]|nr:hypothetical protein [Phycisphaerae bacterium]
MSFRRRGVIANLAIGLLIAAANSAMAMPQFGQNCVNCHSSAGFGHTTQHAVYDIVSDNHSTIPLGAYGDPDRGEGPLATYTALPGGSFTLSMQLKDPTQYDPPFLPTRWAIGIKRPYTTDPDYHAGNPDPLTWRDNQLQLVGAQPGPNYDTPDPAPIPQSAADWSIYTKDDIQYYASTGYGGHEWIGPFLFNVDITVPTGVQPGWYDIEVSAAGWDYDQFFAFYDEEHFYLQVLEPEPTAIGLVTLGGLLARRRKRR